MSDRAASPMGEPGEGTGPRVKMGGLMRCCLESLAQHLEGGGTSDEGQVLPCLYCSSSMVCHENTWAWNRD